MAERIDKLILETEYRTTGDVSGSVNKLDQLGKEAVAAQSDIIKLVEAEKKLEQAANVAGAAVQTETKKLSDFQKTAKGAGDAITGIGTANKLKDAFKVDSLTAFNAKLKEFQKNVISVGLSGGDLEAEIKRLVSSLDGLSEGDAALALEEIGKEAARLEGLINKPASRLRELKRLINTTDDPELLKQLQVEAGKLQDELADTNDLIKALGSESFVTDTLIEGVQTATGAFSAFQGIAALSADSQEQFAEASAKAQSALALLQGVQTVINNLKKEDNIITRGQIIAQRAYAAVVGQSTGAMKGLKLALAATGVGLLVLGLVALISNFKEIQSVLGFGVNPELEKNAKLTRDAAEAAREELDVLRKKQEFLEAIGTDETQILKARQDQLLKNLSIVRKSANDEIAIYNDLKAKRDEILTAAQTGSIVALNKVPFAPSADELKSAKDRSQQAVDDALSYATEIANIDKRLIEIEKERTQKNLENIKKQGDNRLKELSERERHALAIANIERKSAQEILQIQIDFAQQRLAIQRTIPQVDRVDITATENGINELQRQLESVVSGSIADLSDQAAKLRARITESLVFGTVEFDNAVNELIIVEEKLKEATDAISKSQPEVFVEGSLKFLRKQVADLQEALEGLADGTEAFLAIQGSLAEARAKLDELESKIANNRTTIIKDSLLEQLNEEERHAIRLAQIRGASEQQLLQMQLEFAKKRLDILEAVGDEATAQEKRQLKNQIEELEAELEKQTGFKDFVLKYADNIQLLINTTINALQTFVGIAKAANDELIGLQEKRVEAALEIADRGNVSLLKLEQERLDELNRKRAQFVKRQQQLAAIQLVSESLIAIAKAAAQGGAAAPFTIAATLIALAAGLAQARATAQAQSFKKGGVYDTRGGFTGIGPTSGQSLAVGPKPYEYHYQEHIMPAPVTMLGKNREWLEEIRLKKLDIGKMMAERQRATVVLNSGSNEELISIFKRIEKNGFSNTEINFDKEGIVRVVEKTRFKKRKIKQRLG